MSQKPIFHALSGALGVTDTASDAELLRRFTEAGDRTAFELVVRRHADLVWGVCRAALPGDPHTAEDAFQATFLALARKAGSVRDGSAAGWLFRVARNAAVRARARATRRETAPLPDALASNGTSAEEDAARREVAPVVAEEVDRLGANLRGPVVLCFFEGHTHTEAAARLGWPLGTLASRLARAKDVLRDRLTRRGVVLSTAGLATVFTTTPARTAHLTHSALAVVTGPADQVPPAVLSLTQGVLSAMRFTQLKATAALVAVAIGLTGALAALPREESVLTADRAPLVEARAVPAPSKEKPGPKKPDPKELEAKELKALKGDWRVVKSEKEGKEAGEDEMAAMRVVFDGNELRIRSALKEEEESFKIALAPAETPHRIDLTIKDPAAADAVNPNADKVAPGIYELKGDTLKMCVRHFASEKKDRPTEFKGGEGLIFFTLERVKDEKEELKALAGEWKGVKMTVSGKETPADEVAKMKWVIDGSDVLLTEGEKGAKATIKLDPSAAPATIDMPVEDGQKKEAELVGIYFRQGDKLTLCFADPKKEGAVRPTELKPGDGVAFLVLERAPKK